MAITLSGYRYGGTNGADATSVTINPNLGGSGSGGVACNVGDWMVLVITGGSGIADTSMAGDAAGWTIARQFTAPTGAGAFQTGVWIKKREMLETSYEWPLDGTGYGVCYHIFWYSGADNAYAGDFWNRNGHGTSYTNVAPSVTTSVADSLVVSISAERTVAAETDSQITV